MKLHYGVILVLSVGLLSACGGSTRDEGVGASTCATACVWYQDSDPFATSYVVRGIDDWRARLKLIAAGCGVGLVPE